MKPAPTSLIISQYGANIRLLDELVAFTLVSGS
jgi:hypothetical protein